ncbi:universal stress protein [Desulfosporosinus hippei]|uniref:Universal stress protein G n=1 Tax=Desulfosporosinus hippei DSM 8344 TaxID=1121419 RepID=A0A1G7WLH0_9FIRM|nr:universal stress protein [Desulfosporosinus hippei]SDG72070.1 universal stress protein G [Desulfosporosinus hippei DSM 8344]
MYHRIVVPVDSAGHSKNALIHAIKLAKQTGSKPIAIYINPIIPLYLNFGLGPERQYVPFEKSNALDILKDIMVDIGHPPDAIDRRAATGDPTTLIIKMAAEERADLIIMDNKLFGRLAGFRGISNSVIKYATCPVLVVK